ncbi:zeta toxin-domain-containing protein [Apodospora peruviana]|uniref:Zeta toxin-domain-containing protein n=1 Tax=Apodospora peruviana TaxID=516989 RepID=A0AAE0LZW7_9PEZI|nr:zeta toxin-domain-containing protein [Apodospora peruviana]
MAGGIPEDWKLSPAQRQAIFNTEIAPHELLPYLHHHHKDDGKQPLAVIIVGQTGAGKTRLAPDLTNAMVSLGRPPTHFIADTYKTYHPYYAECLASKPEKASILAGLDARVWLTMACEYAATNRLDVLVESACRHPDDFCNLADIFRAAGYRVVVAILAVPEALSRLGILVRYHRNLPEAQSCGLPLRLTPPKVHNDSYAGLASAAEFIDQSPAVDTVIVVRRNNMLAYRNERTVTENSKGRGRVWRDPAGSALKSLEMERTRELPSDESRIAREDIDELKKLGDPKIDLQIQDIEASISNLETRRGDAEPIPTLELLDAAEFIKRQLE